MSFQDPPFADDRLRAVVDSVFQAQPYQWSDTEPRAGWLARWWRVLVDWLAEFRETNPAAADLLFWSLVLVLVLIFLHGGWIMFQAVRLSTAQGERGPEPGALRVRDEGWFRRHADGLAAEGRFSEAMQAAFTALVLRLDRLGILRYDPSATPREYTRAARLQVADRSRLASAVASLYAHAYAGRPVSADDYRAWRAGLEGEWHASAS